MHKSEMLSGRIRNADALKLVTSADSAASLIKDGMTVAVSGFTPSGCPKAVPMALTKQVEDGRHVHLNLYSGASVGREIDEDWSNAGIIKRRYPYQTNTSIRNKINSGDINYFDMHLSQSAQQIKHGPFPKIDIAVIEAIAITESGDIVPTTGIGNAPAFVDEAKSVIVEINRSLPLELEGMADIYVVEKPPYRKPINICSVSDRIGTPYIKCGIDKIAAIVFSDEREHPRPFSAPDEISHKISDNIIAFLHNEVREGRLPETLLPLQSGVGNVANAVLYGLCDSDFHDLTCYTEVVQDSMLKLLRCKKAKFASTTSLSPSPDGLEDFIKDIDFFKDKIILRPQEISNNPEVIRRLGIISMNTAIEADIYGNVNSTHIMGTKMMNGIGGSGDFSRNAAITIFSTPSTAKDGKISSIVPFVSHVDHTEHDVMVLVTEYGYADLRGLSPRERARLIIERCAHPSYKEQLSDYFERACASSAGQTPHISEEALSWHTNFIKNGSMHI